MTHCIQHVCKICGRGKLLKLGDIDYGCKNYACEECKLEVEKRNRNEYFNEGNSYSQRKLERKIRRYENVVNDLKERHGDNPSRDFTYHGGWELGYYQGMLAVLYNLLDEEE